MRELRKYNVDIAYLSYLRIPDSGHSVTKVPGEEACYHLYHSSVVDNTGRHCVAIALSAALLAWMPIASPFASARLKGTTVNLDSLGPWLHRVITKDWLCETVPNN